MDSLQFLKMSASANDFIVIDNRDGKVDRLFPDMPDFVRKVCRRRHSVGADGLILVEKSENVDFAWRFYNADGSVAEMCGNGGRCAARFACLKGIAGARMAFATLAGIMKAEVLADGKVKLQLTTPQDLKLDYLLRLDDKELFVSSVNTGVPHTILLTDHVERAPVEKLGRPIRRHKMFPNGTNVDFVEVMDRENVRIRTYERGVEGETYACGTGAVAAGVVLNAKGLVGGAVSVWTRGGEAVKVYVDGDVYLEGSARVVYEGTLLPDAVEYVAGGDEL
ncbi:MAG TPA: diaminopimelate epimerase [Syntrophorhabdales bacterium]|nr:diaminopimelate epimerase [Syntrophorhabdales bacterium]